jgi:hypothetical protein
MGQLWIADAVRLRPSTARSELDAVLGDESTSDAKSLRRVASALVDETASAHFSSGLRDLLVGFSRRLPPTA